MTTSIKRLTEGQVRLLQFPNQDWHMKVIKVGEGSISGVKLWYIGMIYVAVDKLHYKFVELK